MHPFTMPAVCHLVQNFVLCSLEIVQQNVHHWHVKKMHVNTPLMYVVQEPGCLGYTITLTD